MGQKKIYRQFSNKVEWFHSTHKYLFKLTIKT